MKPPAAYAEWSSCIDELCRGGRDDEMIELMRLGTLDWTGGVAERISRRMFEFINHRLQRAAERFQRDLQFACGDENALILAIVGMRKQFNTLWQAAHLPIFPAYAQKSFADALQQFVEQSQKSLEDSSSGDITGRLAHVVRNNSLRNFMGNTDGAAEGEDGAAPAPQPAPEDSETLKRRRIILP